MAEDRPARTGYRRGAPRPTGSGLRPTGSSSATRRAPASSSGGSGPSSGTPTDGPVLRSARTHREGGCRGRPQRRRLPTRPERVRVDLQGRRTRDEGQPRRRARGVDRGLLRRTGPDGRGPSLQKIAAFNLQTGPFHVEGAEPGDTLALHFVSIEPSRDWAMSTTFPLFGALTSTLRTVTLQDPLAEIVWRYDVDAAKRLIRFERRGTEECHDRAPARSDARDRRRRAGGRGGLFLARPRRPRRQHGHARDARRHHLLPGSGTSRARCSRSGTATAGRVRARPAASPWRPRWTPSSWSSSSKAVRRSGRGWRTDNHVMSTGSARPLEDAFRIAHGDPGDVAGRRVRLDRLDAYQLVSQIAESPVANVCDPNYIVQGAEAAPALRKRYASTRQTLKEIAATYRAERGLGWRPLRGSARESAARPGWVQDGSTTAGRARTRFGRAYTRGERGGGYGGTRRRQGHDLRASRARPVTRTLGPFDLVVIFVAIVLFINNSAGCNSRGRRCSSSGSWRSPRSWSPGRS